MIMEELDVKGYKLYPGFAQSTNKQKASPMTHVSTIYDGDKNLQDIIDEILDEKNSIPEVDRIEIEINPEDWVEKEDGSFGHDYTDPLLTDKVMTEVTADRVNMDLIVKDKIRWMLTEDVVGNTVTIYSEKRPTVKLKLQIIRYTKYFIINHTINEGDWTGNDNLKKYVYQNPDIFAKYLALFRMNRENIRLFLNNNYAITNTTDGQVEIATDNAVALNAQSVFLYTDLIGNIPNGDGNVNPEPPTTPIPPDDHDCIKTRFSKEIIYNAEGFVVQLTSPDVFMGIWNNETLIHLPYTVISYTTLPTPEPYIAILEKSDAIYDYKNPDNHLNLWSELLKIDTKYSRTNIDTSKLGGTKDNMFVVFPGAIIFFMESNVTSNFFNVKYVQRTSIPYITNDGFADTGDQSLILDTLYTGEFYNNGNIYVLYAYQGKIKLLRTKRNTSGSQILEFTEVFNKEIYSLGHADTYSNARLFEYNNNIYVVINQDAKVIKISENGSIAQSGTIIPISNYNYIAAWCVDKNILYTRVKSTITKFNLDTFSIIESKVIPNLDMYDKDSLSFNGMRVIYGHIFAILHDNNGRYLAKLSPTSYNIEDKLELQDRLGIKDQNSDLPVEMNIYYRDSENDSTVLGLFANKLIKGSGDNRSKVLKVTINREGEMLL